ncbi:GIY-YIG nuclease family protein [Chungangia koreensis]|uniref:GIY-YIG nuclease family protein n=1 Tax=Chungangia koreensis TaxID=752657 RepID=A0ABV8X1M2_9LACT
MLHRKTIKIFLIDGDPNGRMACELSNWTGKAYRIPRIAIKDSVDRPELNGTGVYFLFGEDEESIPAVYIGEAESILSRLNQHVKEKDFWNEVIVFISKDDYLNKAHVKYLENKFYLMAKQANRYHVLNGNIPPAPSLSESDQAEMEEYIFHSKILMSTLGHKVFEEAYQPKENKDPIEKLFRLQSNRGAEGTGSPSSDGFVVLAGSECAISTVESFSGGYSKLREKLINQEVIKNINNKLTFVQDYVFSSPSAAAAILLGRKANGLTEWRLKDGRTLKEIESE